MVEQMVIVQLPSGLFARAAANFVQEANQFQADIFLKKDEKTVNAKSIMGVMSLAIAKNEKVILRAEGSDADDAVIRLAQFLTKA